MLSCRNQHEPQTDGDHPEDQQGNKEAERAAAGETSFTAHEQMPGSSLAFVNSWTNAVVVVP